jgi:hypothetical protein
VGGIGVVLPARANVPGAVDHRFRDAAWLRGERQRAAREPRRLLDPIPTTRIGRTTRNAANQRSSSTVLWRRSAARASVRCQAGRP